PCASALRRSGWSFVTARRSLERKRTRAGGRQHCCDRPVIVLRPPRSRPRNGGLVWWISGGVLSRVRRSVAAGKRRAAEAACSVPALLLAGACQHVRSELCGELQATAGVGFIVRGWDWFLGGNGQRARGNG